MDNGKKMGKESRAYEGADGIRSFGEILRSRIDASLALDTIHSAMRGEDISRTQLDAARIALGKCLPDLKAVALSVGNHKPMTKADIDSLLLESGLQPDSVFMGMEKPAIPGEIVDSESTNKSS